MATPAQIARQQARMARARQRARNRARRAALLARRRLQAARAAERAERRGAVVPGYVQVARAARAAREAAAPLVGSTPVQAGTQAAQAASLGTNFPSNCAEKRELDRSIGSAIVQTITNPAGVISEALGDLPVVGGVFKLGGALSATEGFLALLPVYLKIAAGGVVMLAGLSFVLLSATGAAQTLAKATPVGVGAAAVAEEVGRQRRTEAKTRASYRVTTTGKGRVRISSKADAEAAREADEAEMAERAEARREDRGHKGERMIESGLGGSPRQVRRRTRPAYKPAEAE